MFGFTFDSKYKYFHMIWQNIKIIELNFLVIFKLFNKPIKVFVVLMYTFKLYFLKTLKYHIYLKTEYRGTLSKGLAFIIVYPLKI